MKKIFKPLSASLVTQDAYGGDIIKKLPEAYGIKSPPIFSSTGRGT